MVIVPDASVLLKWGLPGPTERDRERADEVLAVWLEGKADILFYDAAYHAVALLADVSAFNIETRYPDRLAPPPSGEEARGYLARIEETIQWLMKR